MAEELPAVTNTRESCLRNEKEDAQNGMTEMSLQRSDYFLSYRDKYTLQIQNRFAGSMLEVNK